MPRGASLIGKEACKRIREGASGAGYIGKEVLRLTFHTAVISRRKKKPTFQKQMTSWKKANFSKANETLEKRMHAQHRTNVKQKQREETGSNEKKREATGGNRHGAGNRATRTSGMQK